MPIALSLNKASLGLPIDPTNGVGDIERKELRAIHNYSFYDDPARMMRLIRFKVRLGYAIDERTRMQYDNAREAEMLTRITTGSSGRGAAPHGRRACWRRDLMRTLEEEKLIELYSPALDRSEAESGEFRQAPKGAPVGSIRIDLQMNSLPLFLSVLMEKLNAKERAALIKTAVLDRARSQPPGRNWKRAAKKLERELKAAKLQKASQLYQVLIKAPGEQVLWLMVYSDAAAGAGPDQELLPEVSAVIAGSHRRDGRGDGRSLAGTPKFQRAKEEMILKRLDARPKKPEPAPEPPPPPPMSSFARGPGVRHQR